MNWLLVCVSVAITVAPMIAYKFGMRNWRLFAAGFAAAMWVVEIAKHVQWYEYVALAILTPMMFMDCALLALVPLHRRKRFTSATRTSCTRSAQTHRDVERDEGDFAHTSHVNRNSSTV